MKVVCSRYAEHIGRKLASEYGYLDVLFTKPNKEHKRDFPDGELYLSLPERGGLAGERAVILTCGQPRPEKSLFELELLVEQTGEFAAMTDIFFLYGPFFRQDGTWKDGEMNIAEHVLKKYSGHRLFTIDAHCTNKEWFVKYVFKNPSAKELLGKAMREAGINLEEAVRVAPDAGESERTGKPGFYKKRIDSRTVEVKANPELIELIRGKTVILEDDIISTGGTMAACGVEAKKYASKVIAAATHGAIKSGVERVIRAFRRENVFLTNTINNRGGNVDITPLVYDAIV